MKCAVPISDNYAISNYSFVIVGPPLRIISNLAFTETVVN